MAVGRIIKWKDITSYSQGETQNIPKTFTIKLGIFTIILTRRHPDTVGWYYSCDGVVFHKLRNTDITLAKKSVIEIFRHNFKHAWEEINLVET